MVKFSIICLLIFATSAERPTFQCKFVTGYWGYIRSIYYCHVISGPSITEFQTEDVVFTGTHDAGKSDDDVKTIQFNSEKFSNEIQYVPLGMEKTFKNLAGLVIQGVGLKGIHKEDLQPFDKLVFIKLDGNNIETLEEGLFDSNRNLQYIDLFNNHIKFIHETVFDNLNNLRTLQLAGNACINEYAFDNPGGALKLIQKAKTKCTSDTDSYKLHQENNPYEKLRKEAEEKLNDS